MCGGGRGHRLIIVVRSVSAEGNSPRKARPSNNTPTKAPLSPVIRDHKMGPRQDGHGRRSALLSNWRSGYGATRAWPGSQPHLVEHHEVTCHRFHHLTPPAPCVRRSMQHRMTNPAMHCMPGANTRLRPLGTQPCCRPPYRRGIKYAPEKTEREKIRGKKYAEILKVEVGDCTFSPPSCQPPSARPGP